MNGEVVLVTGAGRGIGRAIALELARHGAHVAVHYHRDQAAAEATADAIRALGVKAVVLQADLGQRSLSDDFLEQIETAVGPVSLLVCNAGAAQGDLAAFMSLDDWDEQLNLNLRGAVLVSQAVLPGMMRRRRGSIVMVGSQAGTYGSPGISAYAAAKGGLVAFARSLAWEVGSRGIRVNVVSPGPVETAMLADMPETERQATVARTALGRIGQADDVAPVVRFLLSDEARFVSGAVVPVDGGLRTL